MKRTRIGVNVSGAASGNDLAVTVEYHATLARSGEKGQDFSWWRRRMALAPPLAVTEGVGSSTMMAQGKLTVAVLSLLASRACTSARERTGVNSCGTPVETG